MFFYMAASWFRKSAEAGNAQGLYKIASMYETGDGVQKNRALAIKWYRKAAEAGVEDAKAGLARLGDHQPK